MTNQTIRCLLIDTSCSNEHYNGDCDYAQVSMGEEYVSHLLRMMDRVAQLRRKHPSLYNVECWDFAPTYFRSNDKLQILRDVDGTLAAEVSLGLPILLTCEPDFEDEDYQRVECQTTQIAEDEVWWTAYVKHTNLMILTAHVSRTDLLRVKRSLRQHSPKISRKTRQDK